MINKVIDTCINVRTVQHIAQKFQSSIISFQDKQEVTPQSRHSHVYCLRHIISFPTISSLTYSTKVSPHNTCIRKAVQI